MRGSADSVMLLSHRDWWFSEYFPPTSPRSVSGPFPSCFSQERFWTPTTRQARINQERISWRDVDMLQHCIAENGFILPRRTTKLSRRNQTRMAKAVDTARCMAVLPFDWRPTDYQQMPLMDPLQFALDRRGVIPGLCLFACLQHMNVLSVVSRLPLHHIFTISCTYPCWRVVPFVRVVVISLKE